MIIIQYLRIDAWQTNQFLLLCLMSASKMKGILSNTGGPPPFKMPSRSVSKCLSRIRCMDRIKMYGPKVGNSKKSKKPKKNHINQSHFDVKKLEAEMTGIPETPSQNPCFPACQSHLCLGFYWHPTIDNPGFQRIVTGFLEHARFCRC